MKNELGGYIMASVFSGLFGVVLLVAGFLFTFSQTCLGWGLIASGSWLSIVSRSIWSLTDIIEKLEEQNV